MADRKAILEAINRQDPTGAREAAAKRQRVMMFALVGLILAAAAYIRFGDSAAAAGRVQAESSPGLLPH